MVCAGMSWTVLTRCVRRMMAIGVGLGPVEGKGVQLRRGV